MLLLYPDELTVVNTRSIGTWVYVLVPAIYLAVHFYLFHTIGWGLVAIWYAAGWWVWQALGRRLAARKAAAGGDGVTVIPLDQVTSVECRKARKGANWLGSEDDRDDGDGTIQVRQADGAVARPPRRGPDRTSIRVREAEMTGTEEPLTESGIPIRSQLARFRVSGTGRGRGIVFLYPDKLAAVNSSAQLWGIFFGPIVLISLSHLLFHDIRELGSAVGVLAGGWIGQGIGKRLAATRVAANRDGVRLVPLDLITSVQFSGPVGIRGLLTGQVLLVTTADGAEYEFRGMMAGWQDAIAGALTVRGHEVQAECDVITVMPQVMGGEG
jgi:hypothetical protein